MPEQQLVSQATNHPLALTCVVSLLTASFGAILWILKRLFKERSDDFQHIKNTLEQLPCAAYAERLRYHEKELNGLWEQVRSLQPQANANVKDKGESS